VTEQPSILRRVEIAPLEVDAILHTMTGDKIDF
jgi:hypothetical protein